MPPNAPSTGSRASFQGVTLEVFRHAHPTTADRFAFCRQFQDRDLSSGNREFFDLLRSVLEESAALQIFEYPPRTLEEQRLRLTSQARFLVEALPVLQTTPLGRLARHLIRTAQPSSDVDALAQAIVEVRGGMLHHVTERAFPQLSKDVRHRGQLKLCSTGHSKNELLLSSKLSVTDFPTDAFVPAQKGDLVLTRPTQHSVVYQRSKQTIAEAGYVTVIHKGSPLP